MIAWFRVAGLWQVVKGAETTPVPPTPATPESIAAKDAFQLKVDKAAGIIYLMVEQGQRVHLNGIDDDPIKMWDALKKVHMQQRPGVRFNAYDDLFSIRKKEDESLQALINRVDSVMQHIKDLRPDSFSITQLDDELASMAMIRALPEEFSGFSSSLLLKDNLDKATVQQAFVTEETQRRRCANDTPTVGTAFKAVSSDTVVKCDFCGMHRHTIDKCYAYIAAQKSAKENVQNRKKKGGRANKAKEESSNEGQKMELAGNIQGPLLI